MTGFRPPAVLLGLVSAPPLEVVAVVRLARPAPVELDALTAALERVPAACAGDARFTDESPDAASLGPVCRSCPVRRWCAAYAAAARPEVGFWAGTAYPLTNEETS